MLGFSLYSEQNLQRVKYLARLSNMDMHRWPKLMLNAVMNVNCDIDMIRYKWFSSVNNVLNKCNMGYVMKSGIQTDSNWANTFKHIHKIVCHDVWSNTVQEKTSLSDYLQFKDVIKLEEYLLDYTDSMVVVLSSKQGQIHFHLITEHDIGRVTATVFVVCVRIRMRV